MTTRNPRGSEKDGIDYYFVTKKEFEKKISNGEFLEYAKVHGDNYYGTPKDKVEEALKNGEDIILEIDIQGALEVKEKMAEGIFIFIMPPSMKILKERLTNRGTESEDKVLERFKTAYKEINEYTKYNYVVVNDEVESAVEKVEAIIKAEKCRVDRIEEVFLNNPEEQLHESLVDKDLLN
jgi:guanylate kinase